VSTNEPDQTLFYVLIALMVTLIIVAVIGIIVMCVWWPAKTAAGGYVEPDDNDDVRASPLFDSKKGKGLK
jgi:hypothetical protein